MKKYIIKLFVVTVYLLLNTVAYCSDSKEAIKVEIYGKGATEIKYDPNGNIISARLCPEWATTVCAAATIPSTFSKEKGEFEDFVEIIINLIDENKTLVGKIPYKEINSLYKESNYGCELHNIILK